MGYDRRWLEDEGSQDSQGRTYWALGLTVKLAPTNELRDLARELFLRALPAIDRFEWLRSWTFAIHGLEHFLADEPKHQQPIGLRERLAKNLSRGWEQHASDDWPWWEDAVTYNNAKLCHARMLAGVSMKHEAIRDDGLRSLHWLIEQQTANNPDGSTHLSIIGSDGWLRRGHARAKFDQQPLEAYALADACLYAAWIDTDHGEDWQAKACRC
jgi:hypothetical protein